MPIIAAGIAFFVILGLICDSDTQQSAVQQRGNRSHLTQAERARRQYWYYRRKSGYRWK